MKVDVNTVKRVAKLARIAVDEEEAERMSVDMSALFDFVDQLNEVDVTKVEAMTSVKPMALRMREDKVTEGNYVDDVLMNAPLIEENFFLVPKVVE